MVETEVNILDVKKGDWVITDKAKEVQKVTKVKDKLEDGTKRLCEVILTFNDEIKIYTNLELKVKKLSKELITL